ncbi:hypothetical protein MASR2M117_10680 [Paludibacter sp.]
MDTVNNIKATDKKEDSIKDIIVTIKELWTFLLSKWVVIVIFGFSGALIGLGLSFIVKPKYTATVSFALIEGGSSGSGLASLASSFGFGGLFGGSGDVFTGDNLLEIIKSRHAIEKTLLTNIEYDDKKMSMADAYLKIYKLDKALIKKNPKTITDLVFPINQKREDFSRLQDSVLFVLYDNFIKSKKLTVIRKEKKISMVSANFTSLNEEFSKIFIERLIQQTVKFYTETRTAQSRSNIDMMQHTADSIKGLYEDALYGGAAIPQLNINMAIQTAAVPRIKQENDAMLYGTVYAEVLKNLETLKLDLARETPIIQIIDSPRFPLRKEKLGKAKGIVFGGFIGGILIVGILLGKRSIKIHHV